MKTLKEYIELFEAITVKIDIDPPPDSNEQGTWIFSDHNGQQTYISGTLRTAIHKAKQEYSRLHQTKYLKIFLIGKQ